LEYVIAPETKYNYSATSAAPRFALL